MPSLPRIRRSRARGGLPAIAPAPVVHELTASGLTWVNVVSPGRRDGAGARSALRLASARRRGHRLEAPAAEGRRLRGRRLPLRRPPLPVLRQPGAAAQRGRARPLRRTRLGRHDPEPRAPAGHTACSPGARRTTSSASSSSRAGPVACSTRSSTTSSTTASRSSTRSPTSSTASRTRCSRAARRRSCATSPT